MASSRLPFGSNNSKARLEVNDFEGLQHFREADKEAVPQQHGDGGGSPKHHVTQHGYASINNFASDAANEKDVADREDKRRSVMPFGLRPWTFGLLIALATAVVVGVLVGGPLGAALAKANNDRPSSATATLSISTKTVTTTATAISTSTTDSIESYSPPPLPQISTLAYNCPDLNTQTYTTATSDTYSFVCGIDYYGGDPSSSGAPIGDLMIFLAYTLEDCVDSCSRWNALYNSTSELTPETQCRGVTFKAAMADLLALASGEGGNGGLVPTCWVKNGTGVGRVATDLMEVSARLEFSAS